MEEWFKELYKTHYNDLYRFIYVLCGRDNSVVEDIVQETFMTFYKKHYQLKEHPYIKGWLYTTARNKTMDYMKKKKRIKHYESELLKTAQSYYIEKQIETFDILSKYLSQDEIELLRLNKEYGFTAKEIANSMGLKPDTVGKRIYRLTLKLRDKLTHTFLIILIIVWRCL